MINTFYAIKYKSPTNYYILPQIRLKHEAEQGKINMGRSTAVHSTRQDRSVEGGDITFVGPDLNPNKVLYGDCINTLWIQKKQLY